MAFEVVVRGGSNYMLSWLTCVCVCSRVYCAFFSSILFTLIIPIATVLHPRILCKK